MCEFTPDPDEVPSWYLRDCPHCGLQWGALHCVHEGDRSCPSCKKTIAVPRAIIDDGEDYASESGRKEFLRKYACSDKWGNLTCVLHSGHSQHVLHRDKWGNTW